MNKNSLKNIVVFKNLPSNIVDEAIVILKPNQKIKKLEVIDSKNKNRNKNEKSENNLYVISEAEMILNNYISKIEKNKTTSKNNNYIDKYNRLKKYSIFSSIVLITSIILHFV